MIELKQSPVVFHESSHTYELDGVILNGITSTLVKRAYPDTYKDIPEEILAAAAERGSNMHRIIENYDEMGLQNDLPELQGYIRIMQENHLDVVATEYIVSDEEHYATAIDKVMLDEQGQLILVDLKNTSTIHYENVALQLSICKRLFEKQNEGLKVRDIYVLWLRDDKAKFERLNPVSDEFIDKLVEADLADAPFDVQSMYSDLPAHFHNVEKQIADYERMMKQAKAEQDKLRAGMLELMEKHNVKSWEGDMVKITRVPASERESFDSKAFKEKHPELYAEFIKKSTVKHSLKITLK